VRSELHEALVRFENAASPDITRIGVEWPTFTRFLKALAALERLVDQFATRADINTELHAYRRARRILKSSLLSPAHPYVGLGEVPYTDQIDGDLVERFAAVRASVAEMLVDSHPGADKLVSVLAGADRVSPGHPGTVRVLTSGDLVEPLRNVLRDVVPTQWNLEVNSRSEARLSNSCSLTVICGAPEYLVGWRIPPPERAEQIAWLFNAPMSPRTLVLQWPGNPPFDGDSYRAARWADQFDPRIEGPRAFTAPDAEELRPVVALARPSTVAPAGDELFDAVDVLLPGDKWISFGLEVGPRPVRIDDAAEFGVEIERRVNVNSLRPGNTLIVVRVGEDRELRRELCREWVDGRNRRGSAAAAEATVEVYRKTLRRAWGNEEVIRKLRRAGLEEEYIRSQLIRAWDPTAMAPKKHANFVTIARAVGLEFGDAEWEQIKLLRGGYISAGTTVRQRLLDAIVNDGSWADIVDQGETASVVVEGLGEVMLAPVVAIAEGVVSRALGELGIIQ
jgi:hypothetical protein